MRWTLLCGFLCAALLAGAAEVGTDGAAIEGRYLRLLMTPADHGAICEFGLTATHSDDAAGDGLLLEGFGADSHYVPSRRLNEKLEVLDSIADRPVLQYSYDCDGPNVAGLHVTRTMEPIPDEASVRVRWKIENRGKEALWLAPWVRSEVAPGGALRPETRVDVPSVDGVRAADRNAYYSAARNWIAATDPVLHETVYSVFDADQTYAFLVLRSAERKLYALQTAFVPRLFKPGDAWETVYRLNAVRNLSHVDFATDQLAVQVDYRPGTLEVYLAGVKALSGLQIDLSIVAPNKQVWQLPAKAFDLSPDKVVRCTYEWTAPGDGAYELLAQVSSQGKPVELGAETGSPHGGIDTQFLVGTPKQRALEPWTDAPFTLKRGARTLKRALAAPGDTAIWIESPLEKLFPDDAVEPNGDLQPTISVGLARNERESFQVALRPPEGATLSNLGVDFGDLVHADGTARIPAVNLRVASVRYSQVRVPTHFEGPTGPWPDALDPKLPDALAGGTTHALWFTVYAPAGIPAGRYAGPITMHADGMNPVELHLEATVYDFDLPAASALKTDFGISVEAALEGGKKLGYAGSAQQLKDAYLKDALQHRITLRDLCALPAESPDYPSALKAFQARLPELLKQGATTFAVPPSLLGVPEQLKLADAFVAENHLENRVFCPLADEPLQPTWPRLYETMQHWIDAAPHIPLMITTFGMQPFLPDALPIWGVHAQMLDSGNGKPVLDRIKEGREVWWYVDDSPPRPYANFFLDFPAMEHRVLFWQTWALGMRGFHYWNINETEAGVNPYDSLLSTAPANGDGFLVYPGPDGPVDSIRWETLRDGIEDYDYLALLTARINKLEAAGGNADLLARAGKVYNLQALIPNLVGFTRDASLLQQKRRDIAAMIVELGPATK